MINDIYQKVVAYKNGADGRFFCVMADEEQYATTGRDVSAGFIECAVKPRPSGLGI